MNRLMTLTTILFVAIMVSAGCATPSVQQAYKYHDDGLKTFLDNSGEETFEAFENSVKQGFYIPGVFAAMGIVRIKNGQVPEGLKYLYMEYNVYGDPLVLDYIKYIKEKFSITDENGGNAQ